MLQFENKYFEYLAFKSVKQQIRLKSEGPIQFIVIAATVMLNISIDASIDTF